MAEPELRHLRSFLAVAAELNFTRAAARLHLAQPALSAQIRQLEQHLGVRLFERNTHEVRITEAGQALREQLEPALTAVGRAMEAAQRAGDGTRGRITLAHSASSGYDTVPTLLAVVRVELPDLRVDAFVLDTPAIPAAVASGTVDIAVARYCERMDGLRYEVLRTEPQGVLLSEAHPLATAEALRVDDLAGHALRVPDRRVAPGRHDALIALLRARAVVPELVVDEVRFDPGHTRIRSGELIGITTPTVLQATSGLRWVPLLDAPTVDTELVFRVAAPPTALRAFVPACRRCRDHQRWTSA
jgi:LysR family transcriptional regulator, benzoate and cis,cis-muconate-responsive activator of ben and cat genes